MEKIKVTNGYLERILTSKVVESIIKKDFTTQTSYWLATVFESLPSKARIYSSERQKLIEKYAKRYEEDVPEDEKGNKAHKKGDIMSDGVNVVIGDVKKFNKALNELLNIERQLEINKIPFDLEKEPPCTVEEMGLLLPLIEVKE